MNDCEGRTVPGDEAAFRFFAEKGNVVGPAQSFEPGGVGIVVTVHQKHAHAECFQAAAAFVEHELGPEALIFLIADVASEKKKIGALGLAEIKKPGCGREGGFV